MKKLEAKLLSGEVNGGQATTEYIMIIALLVVALAAVMIAFREEVQKMWMTATATLQTFADPAVNAVPEQDASAV